MKYQLGQKLYLVDPDDYEIFPATVIKNDIGVYGVKYITRAGEKFNSLQFIEEADYDIYTNYTEAYQYLKREILTKMKFFVDKLNILEGGIEV